MQPENLTSDDVRFPWADVAESRRNELLQRDHAQDESRQKHALLAKPCPRCQAPATELSWFYFESPAWAWEKLCGRAGWMTVCNRCHVQVDFFLELMN